MDKKTARLFIGLLFVSVLSVSLCVENKQPTVNPVVTTQETAETTPATETPQTPETTQNTAPEHNPLSDLQKEACNSADQGGTCYTKLAELDIVSAEDCCKYMAKCCKK